MQVLPIWIFAPKIVILCKYRINNNWKLLNFDNFWRENSNSNRNQCIIIKKNHSIWAQKFKFTILWFFWKLNFWIWDFLTLWKGYWWVNLPYHWYHQGAKDPIDIWWHACHQNQTALDFSFMQKSKSWKTMSDSREEWKHQWNDSIHW